MQAIDSTISAVHTLSKRGDVRHPLSTLLCPGTNDLQVARLRIRNHLRGLTDKHVQIAANAGNTGIRCTAVRDVVGQEVTALHSNGSRHVVGGQVTRTAPGLLSRTRLCIGDQFFPVINFRVLTYRNTHRIVSVAANPVEFATIVLVKNAAQIVSGHRLRVVSHNAVTALISAGNVHNSH